jgi:hypothetical protein
MTQRTAGSFLIRIDATDDGHRAGTVTSVQTGEHAPFDGFSELAHIIDRWAGSAGPLHGTQEEKT